MQVFLLLLDSTGSVVTRDQLFDAGWGGAMVGDDSLNRVINRVRRIAAETGPGLFEIQTIPRTGYRLTGASGATAGDETSSAEEMPRLSRRTILGSATAVGVLAAGGAGAWAISRARQDREFTSLVERAEIVLDYSDPSAEAVRYLRPAAELRPNDARVRGLLAYALCATARNNDPRDTNVQVKIAEDTARGALAMDPREPNARLALFVLQGAMLDLPTSEKHLRDILKTDPDNIYTMRYLWGLLQSSGYSREAFALVERAIAMKPLAAMNNYPRAQLLWILGRNAEADRVIDQALEYWPEHRWIRFARFMILAFTDRPRAALAMLNDERKRPQSFSPEAVEAWRISLKALDDPTKANVVSVQNHFVRQATENLALAGQAIIVLSALDELDQAFDVANDLFLFRRAVEPIRNKLSARQQIKSTSWRFAPWLFIPPTAPMRADPRFNALCEGIGLTEYWAQRGVKPDYQLGIT
jgi:tetratricopeptide (TPR) repeat protein